MRRRLTEKEGFLVGDLREILGRRFRRWIDCGDRGNRGEELAIDRSCSRCLNGVVRTWQRREVDERRARGANRPAGIADDKIFEGRVL